MKASWSQGLDIREASIASWADLLPVLDAIYRDGRAVLLQIWIEGNGTELGVGLGRPRAVFTYQASLDPPYYVSVGDHAAQGVESFWYGGDATEYLARNLVPSDLVIPTIQAFLASSSRPTTVEWETL